MYLCFGPQSVFVRVVRCSPTACRLVPPPARLLVLWRRVSVGTSVWGGVSVSRVCTCTRVSVCDGTTVPASTDATATAQETPSDSAATPGESNISMQTETTVAYVLRLQVPVTIVLSPSVCRAGQWECSGEKCEAQCAVIGAMHINTFDQKRYGLQAGDCRFTAVEVSDREETDLQLHSVFEII